MQKWLTDKSIEFQSGENQYGKNRFFYRSVFACLIFGLSLESVQAQAVAKQDNCPKPVVTDAPFSDFDDLMTADEKREALHEDLARKLARHKGACKPTTKTNSKAANTTAKKAENDPSATDAPSEQQAKQQADQPTNQQQADQQQTGDQQISQQQTNQQQANQAQSSQAQAGQQANQAQASQQQPGQRYKYTSPWATKPANEPGGVALEPLAPSQAEAPAKTGQATGLSEEPANPQSNGGASEPAGAVAPPSEAQTQTDLKSLPANGISGVEPSADSDAGQSPGQSSGSGGKPGSKFLEIYGGASQTTPESLEAIANRHKNRQSPGVGTPGNTGPNQQNPNYSDPGKRPTSTTTIGANDAVIKALEKRLATETDPQKRKEIQAELDKYKKKS